MKIVFSNSLVFLFATAFINSDAFAVDLVNRDSGSYEVQVRYSRGEYSTSIAPVNTIENICEERCTIEVKGSGTAQADSNDSVIIEEGELVVIQD